MRVRTVLLAAATLAIVAPPASAEQNLNKRVTVAPDVTVTVSNVQGSVDVTAWDRNEVELEAQLESDKDQLEFEATDRQVRIEVDRPDSKYRHSDVEDAILTLRVPKGARLVVDTVSADITVNGVRGDQSLDSVSGTIETQAYDAPVSLQSVSGDVTATGNGGKAIVSTENVSGTTTVSGIRGGFEGEAVSGDITATVAAAERLRVGSVSGNVEVHTDLTSAARVEMESISGVITLILKPPVNADFEIESFSGDIENCFGPEPRDKNRYTPGSELNFTQGNGSARVEINTLSGEISVCNH